MKSSTRRIGSLVAIATMVVFTLTGCADRRDASTRVGDAAITAKVKAKIAADPQVNPFEVDVDTVDRVVRLSGTVESDADRDEMERLAESVAGVARVDNDLRIGDPKLDDHIDSTAIELRVKSRLTADPDVNPFRIDVDVVGGVVTLTGEVDDERTKDHAGELAAGTKGVDDVLNRIDVREPRS